MIKLKPCPFCGGQVLRECDEDVFLVCVSCEKCGAEGPFAVKSMAWARKKWNKRSKI